MAYEPNINDPRVNKKIRHALRAILRYLPSEDHQCEFDRNWLNKNLGELNKPLGRYLRTQLLKCKSDYYSKTLGISKTYVLRIKGVDKHLALLGMPPMTQFVRTNLTEQYADEFRTGNFIYSEIKDRFYHPLQNIKKEERYELFSEAGYQYHYDIQCCAPTLIYQAALKYGMKPQPVISKYLGDRKQFRDHLSASYNIEPAIIKTILTAIFTGAQLGKSHRSRLYRLLSNYKKMEALCANTDIIEMKKEITRCWRWIRKFNSMKCTGVDKSAFYREQEKHVMNSIKAYARQTHIKEFSIHDGWITSAPMDLIQLQRHIEVNTGYKVNIDDDSSVVSSKDEQVSLSVIRGQATHSETSLVVLATPRDFITNRSNDRDIDRDIDRDRCISDMENIAITVCMTSPIQSLNDTTNKDIDYDNKRRFNILDTLTRESLQDNPLGDNKNIKAEQGHRSKSGINR